MIEYPPVLTKPAYENGDITFEWRNWLYWFYFAIGNGLSPLQIIGNKLNTKDGSVPNITPDGDLSLNGIVWNNPSAAGQVCTMRNGVVTWKDPGDIETAVTGIIRPIRDSQIPNGWLLMDDGTIGSFNSFATTMASDTTEDLFKLIWNNTADAQCPVSGGRGVDANHDWDDNKTIALPQVCGRAVRQTITNCETSGEETLAMAIENMPPHPHLFIDPDLIAECSAGVDTAPSGIIGAAPGTYSVGTVVYNNLDPFAQAAPTSVTTAAGSGDAQNNMQPTIFKNFMIKL